MLLGLFTMLFKFLFLLAYSILKSFNFCFDLLHLKWVVKYCMSCFKLSLFYIDHRVFHHLKKSFILRTRITTGFLSLQALERINLILLCGICLPRYSFDSLSQKELFAVIDPSSLICSICSSSILVHPVESLQGTGRNDTLLDLYQF